MKAPIWVDRIDGGLLGYEYARYAVLIEMNGEIGGMVMDDGVLCCI